MINVKINLLSARSQRDQYQDKIRNARDLLEGKLVNRKGKSKIRRKSMITGWTLMQGKLQGNRVEQETLQTEGHL